MINTLAKIIHENAKEKGFYLKDKNIVEMLCLIHAEISEALEADRKNKRSIKNIENFKEIDDDEFVTYYNENIKGSFEEEMADIIIRVLDLCAYKNIDIESHIFSKIRFNKTREFLHGKLY